jgi:multiple sugar transport system substrate-binding protein
MLGPMLANPTLARAAGLRLTATELAMMMGPFSANDPDNQKIISDAYTAKNPDVTINFQNYDWAQMNPQINAAFASGSPPDLIYLIDSVYPRFAVTRQLRDITPYVNAANYAAEKKHFVGWDIATYNGKIYGIPVATAVNMIFYNKALFRKAGIRRFPRTYAELREVAKELTDPKRKVYGFAMRSNVNEAAWFDWLAYVYNSGGALLSKNLRSAGFNTPEVVDAMQLLQNLNSKDKVAPAVGQYDSQGLQALFSAGRVAMLMGGQIFVSTFQKQKLPFGWDIAKAPRGPKASVVIGDFGFHMIPAKSKYPEEAFDYARFWTSKPQLVPYMRTSGGTPLRTDIDPRQLYPGNAVLQKVVKEFVPHVTGTQPSPKYQQALQQAWPFIVQGYQGRLTPAKSVQRAAAAVNRVLKG